jgi:hypothetical protein
MYEPGEYTPYILKNYDCDVCHNPGEMVRSAYKIEYDDGGKISVCGGCYRMIKEKEAGSKQ